jgi:putative drug exporter of the RND superfamily
VARASALPHAAGAAAFGRLGRAIVRHPTYPILFWVVLLVATVPFLHLLGSVTTNSTDTLPSNAPSSEASARLAQLFPNTTSGASSILLFYGANATDSQSQSIIEGVTAALEADPSLSYVASIASIYTGYAAYLAGQTELAAGAVAGGLAASPSLPNATNDSAVLLWGPPAAFFTTWETLATNRSEPASYWNYPAYNATRTAYANSSAELAVLDAFYLGNGSSNAGFNGTPACANQSGAGAAEACADSAARTNLPYFIASSGYVPLADRPLAQLVLGGLGIENATSWPAVRSVAATDLAAASGLPGSWIDTVWTAFPTGTVSAAHASDFANRTVAAATLATEPLAVPLSLRSQFVDPAGTASLVNIAFTVSDSYSTGSGATPVYSDLDRIDSDVHATLARLDPSGSLTYYQTGPAPLDALSQQAVNASLGLVLPLTVGLLLGISMIYFRSPVTPLVTFGGLAIALVLGLGATVLVGTLVTHVDSTALTLEEVFVLGVGTDYSIFLVARYREELIAGRSSDEAIVASLSWAGQSVATSGSAAVIVTVALTFSGIALLSQWGLVLSFAILITMLLSLTVVPAALKLLGPRIFWPTSGERFRRRAEVVAERLRRRETYFHRAGRATERRPATIVGLVLLATVPLAAIALTVPVSYDFYGQLPAGHPASTGLSELGTKFGDGFATQSFVLVSFAASLLPGGVPNATEFLDLGSLTTLANETAGIAAVQSPIGPFGAPMTDWLDLPHLPAAQRANLLGIAADYIGNDGRTVLLTLQTNATGLSTTAVSAVHSVAGAYAAYATGRPEISSFTYGGAAPVISDLANETDRATELMLVAVTVGLVVVLLVVLRSWMIALMAIGTIALSISWAWAITYLVFDQLVGFPLFFYVRTILIMLILGLGIDYNIFLLTRVREERLKGAPSGDAAVEAVARTGGIITAAAVILASAFGVLLVGEFTLIRAIGFSVAVAVILDAMVVRTYLVPSALRLLGDRVWSLSGRARRPPPHGASAPDAGEVPGPAAEPAATR